MIEEDRASDVPDEKDNNWRNTAGRPQKKRGKGEETKPMMLCKFEVGEFELVKSQFANARMITLNRSRVERRQ